MGKSRGPARDAATIFDENAALLVVRDDAAGRALVDDAARAPLASKRCTTGAPCSAATPQVWLFGHALMEKLVAPRKAITAHTRVVFVPMTRTSRWRTTRAAPGSTARWRHALAGEGLEHGRSGFTPLQVLGVPGWWPGQDADFYRDTTVFRPRRTD